MNYISTFLASFLIWVMFFGLIIFWVFRKELASYQVVHILSIIAVALLIAQLIKEAFPSPRPFIVDGTTPLTLTVPGDSTFPSSHTAVAFSMVFGLFYHNRKVGALFFPPALLVGFGRVISNVHFPIDIIGGILLSLAISLIFTHSNIVQFYKRLGFTP